MIFKSAIDPWFYGVVVVAAIVLIAATIPVLMSGSKAGLMIMGVSGLLAVGLPIWLMFSTYYQVQDEVLTVRSGPFTWIIDVEAIESVELSNSLLSSPALSLDRLEIKYDGGKSLLVSPKNRAGFIEALQLSS